MLYLQLSTRFSRHRVSESDVQNFSKTKPIDSKLTIYLQRMYIEKVYLGFSENFKCNVFVV